MMKCRVWLPSKTLGKRLPEETDRDTYLDFTGKIRSFGHFPMIFPGGCETRFAINLPWGYTAFRQEKQTDKTKKIKVQTWTLLVLRCTHIPPVAAQLLPSPFGRDIHPGGNCCQIVRGSSKLANTKKSLVLSREFRDCCCGGGGGRGCCSALCAPRNAPRKTPQKTNKQTGTGTRIKTKTRFHKR